MPGYTLIINKILFYCYPFKMSSNFLLSYLNQLEKWLENTKSKYYLFPLRIIAYLFLFLALMISNLFAIIRWPLAFLQRKYLSKNNHQPNKIAPHVINEVNAELLEQALKKEPLVLIDFWAEWCGPCIMMNKSLERIAESDDVDCTVVKVDTVQHKELADKFGVKGLPTLILYKNYEERKRYAGALSYPELKRFVDP